MRVGHMERSEYALGAELRKRLSRNARSDFSEQRKPRVRIEIASSGPKIQFLLTEDQPQCLVLRDDVLQTPPCKRQRLPLVANAAGMLQEIADRDLVAVIRQLGQVFLNLVIKGKLAIQLEKHDGHCRELLGNRCYVEDGVGLDRDAVFEIGDSVSFRENQFAVLYDRYRGTRGIRCIPVLENRVNLVALRNGVGPCGMQWRRGWRRRREMRAS